MRSIILSMSILALVGCTTYDVRRADGTELRIRSMRSFPNGISVKYESPQGGKLEVQTGAVESGAQNSQLLLEAAKLLLMKQAPQ